MDIIRSAYYIRGLELMELIFAVLDVSLTMDLTRYYLVIIQDAQLSQRDRAAACVIVFAKSRRLELGDNILRTL